MLYTPPWGTPRTAIRAPEGNGLMRNELALSRRSAAADPAGGALAVDEADWCFGRSIVVLAPGDRLDAEALARAVGSGSPRLLLLSVGHPPTLGQSAGFDAGLRFALERGICFEARLAWSLDEALDAVSPLDEVLRCPAGQPLQGVEPPDRTFCGELA
jgi:hypothetical protein